MNQEAEVEYRLLLLANGGDKKILHPDFIEIFSYKCDNPWFRSIEFRRLLIEYRVKVWPRLMEDAARERRVLLRRRIAKKKRERPKRKYEWKNPR